MRPVGLSTFRFALAPTVLALITGAGIPSAHAAQKGARPLSAAVVRAKVNAYAKERGLRLERLGARVDGVTASGKSTRAIVSIDAREVGVVVNHKTGRVQSAETGRMVDAMLAAHVPQVRAGVGRASRFAQEVLGFEPGEGVSAPLHQIPTVPGAPVGRPRAGQSVAQLAYDAKSLGRGGRIWVGGFNTPVIAGRPGAGFRIKESGVSDASGTIINQTPALVEAVAGSKTYRLGWAGYKAAGDLLLIANAIDKIPVGTVIDSLRVTDDPNAPRPHGVDPTDDAVAAARGVGGFDFVSAEAIVGRATTKKAR